RHEARLGEAVEEALGREAVVGELGRLPRAAARDDDALRSERAVEQPLAVEVLDPAERLDRDLDEERPRSARGEALEVGAVEELVDDVEVAAVHSGEVDLGRAVIDDLLQVRVLELRQGVELLLEVSEAPLAAGLLERFEEDERPPRALRLVVLDEVDARVAPRSELLEDGVTALSESPDHLPRPSRFSEFGKCSPRVQERPRARNAVVLGGMTTP